MGPNLFNSIFARAVALGLAYWITVVLAIELVSPVDKIALFWPPNAIAAAALIFSSRKHWPHYLIAMALGFFAARLPAGHLPYLVYFGFCAANIIEVLIVAGAVKRFIRAPIVFENINKVLLVVIVASIPASLVGALISGVVVTSAVENATFWGASIGWFTGDLSGLLLVLPVLVTWLAPGAPLIKSYSKDKLTERVVIATAYVAVGLLTAVYLTKETQISLIFPYLVFPVLIWGAMRLGIRSTAVSILAVGLFAIALTYLGRGPFSIEGLSAFDQVVLMKFGLIVITLTTVFLSIVVMDRRRAEGNLASQKSLFEAIFTGISDAIVYANINRDIVSINPGLTSTFGYEPDELVGKQTAVLYTSPEDYERQGQLRFNLSAAEQKQPYEVDYQKKDGTVFSGETLGTKITNANGDALGYIGVIRDITERKQTEEKLLNSHNELELKVEERTKELSESMKKAKIANLSKSNLLANMSHELRTPLNAIIGFSNTMQEETFGPLGHEKYREYLDDIHHSGQHLLELINDILDVSAVEAGAIKLHEETINAFKVVESSVRLIKPRAESGQVIVTSSVDPKLPEIYVDERRMKQVVLNLLSNAVKFTPEGGEVSVSARLNDDGSFSISVSDNGIGMDDDEVTEALSTFGQADSGLDRKHEGTGLGLPLTAGLMELHGGSLKIKSKRGHGTVVTAIFPKERVGQSVC